MRQFTKRELYQAGEPLGECVTRTKPGGRIYGGGGGGSSSSTADTTNIDKRLAVGDGGAGISGDNSSIVINSTDGAIVTRALDSVDSANAVAGDGFSALLQAADKLFAKGESLIKTTQDSVSDAYLKAATEGKGTIDNKTIIVLAVAGAVAVYAMKKGR